MTTRRDFLKLNIGAVSAGVLSGVPIIGSALDKSSTRSSHAFLYDESIDGVLPQVETLRVQSQRSYSVEGDLGGLWIHDLWPQLKTMPSYIVGITRGYHAFAIQEASRDFGHAILYSDYYDEQKSHLLFEDKLSTSVIQNSLDPLALNTSAPVLWLMGPSGVNFHA